MPRRRKSKTPATVNHQPRQAAASAAASTDSGDIQGGPIGTQITITPRDSVFPDLQNPSTAFVNRSQNNTQKWTEVLTVGMPSPAAAACSHSPKSPQHHPRRDSLQSSQAIVEEGAFGDVGAGAGGAILRRPPSPPSTAHELVGDAQQVCAPLPTQAPMEKTHPSSSVQVHQLPLPNGVLPAPPAASHPQPTPNMQHGQNASSALGGADSLHQWTRCLVGFFPGYNMPFPAMQILARRAWKTLGLEDVISAGTGFFLFRFHSEEALQAILEQGPWGFGRKFIVLQQWHPHVVYDKSRVSKVPVWIRLHNLPFPLWNERCLGLVASRIGRPILCDRHTSDMTRLAFARLCVELSAADEPISEFEIACRRLSDKPIRVRVKYEWIPKRCSKCSVFGHSCSLPTVADSQSVLIAPKHN
ncbi:hypothetical protein K2173_006571 [Erythroxylum novogranatense]|uniref:DUF4283 domain-containing protein n=1 Tax=Erythroxylum novogranatense TaxID=1862640 RepID=A0AAV8T7B3_9ROSI|nr:hypothetical protein K2173_006571 [Erythroxylum novogranatense]